MVQEWYSNNKKRREQQMSSFKRKEWKPTGVSNLDWMKEWEAPGSHHYTNPWNADDFKGGQRGNRFMLQTLVSCSFLFLTYLVLQSHSPAVKPVENFVYEAMTREFNFAGAASLYNKYVGNMPSVLPAFSNSTVKQSGIMWRAPAKGKIVLPYNHERRGLVVRTGPDAAIAASADGWIVFAGYKEGLGNTVIIRHADEQETWYGRLGSLAVKSGDWVKGGQSLGDVNPTDEQSLLYFALKRNQQFIDPSGVILFDE